ncbi:MAG: PilT/PilU family type 4a pilus ATPase [Geminicoccaceae bacterium]|nr:PilT/PilU family type 4a pilus ATPase [Geminicoccaceae bacterium]
MVVEELLRAMMDAGASDLHLSVGDVPVLRRDGLLERLDTGLLDEAWMNAALERLLGPERCEHLHRARECDVAVEAAGGRFRANAFFNRKGPALVLRHVHATPPCLASLGAPETLVRLADLDQGLVLITGPTGSGKSSTLAGMIRHVNETGARHVVTIEDPIEFVHESRRALVTQREVGRDTLGFGPALRSALREDPDVILVGEMRDHETIALALTAAETGHLVLGTLHTSSAHRALLRIVDAMPAAGRDMARAMLAASLQGVVAQTLLPKIGGGRVAAFEVLVGTHAVRHMIQENQPAQIYSAMQTGARHGMRTMADAVAAHIRAGLVDSSVADAALRALAGDVLEEAEEARAAAPPARRTEAPPADDRRSRGWTF